MAEVRSGSFKTTGYSDANSPDHYVFSWTLASQSIVDNTTTINWEVVAAGGSTAGYYNSVKEKYVTVYGTTKTNSDWQTTYNGTKPFSGTTVIKHDSNGKGSFSASCGGAFEYSGAYNSTGSGSWDLPTIARATTPVLAATTITMGSSINITLTPANSTFKHKLRYDFGTIKGSASGFSMGAEYTAQGNRTVTFTPPTSLGSQIPNNLSGTGQIICYTYTSSGTHIGTTYVKITLNIPSYTPTITGVTLTGHNLLSGEYVQGKSNVTVNATIPNSNALYGANIKSITSVIDGKSYSGLPFTTNVLSSGSKTVKITLVDTRDKSVTVESAGIAVYAYSAPSITAFHLERQADGTTVIAALAGSISALNNKNTKSFSITLNGVTNNLTVSGYTVNGVTTFTNVPTDSTLIATATIKDYYTTTKREATLPTVAVTMDFHHSGTGVAFGKVAEHSGYLDVNWNAQFSKYLLASSTMFAPLIVNRVNSDKEAAMRFENSNGVLGYIGMMGGINGGLRRWTANSGTSYLVLDAGNTKDFIVEQGTNGIWTYRKWNSGYTECWGNVSTTPTTVNGNNSIVVNLPFAFVGTDYKVNISPAKAAMYITSFGDCATNGNITHTTTNFTMAYKYSYGTAYTVSFNVNVYGRWK